MGPYLRRVSRGRYVLTEKAVERLGALLPGARVEGSGKPAAASKPKVRKTGKGGRPKKVAVGA